MIINWFKRRLKANLIVSILLLVFLALILYAFLFGGLEIVTQKIIAPVKIKNAKVKVTYLYVGQGDATLIRDLRENGRVMLIDGGPSDLLDSAFLTEENKALFDAGKAHIIPYLEKEGIKTIDFIVLSHKDRDHIGGLIQIMKNIKVRAVFDSATPCAEPLYLEFLKVAEEKAIKYSILKAGEEIGFGENIVCQALAPLRSYSEIVNVENNSSIVVRLSVGKVSFLFPADIEIPAEFDLTAYGRDIRTTVLKVPHHGSASSSSWPFLDKVRPEVAVFSCGRSNRYGLPEFEIIRRYEKIGAKSYRTDLCGNIEIFTDGKKYTVLTGK